MELLFWGYPSQESCFGTKKGLSFQRYDPSLMNAATVSIHYNGLVFKRSYINMQKCYYIYAAEGGITVRKRNNLTTSVTLLDELPVSDLFFADNKPGIFPIYDNTKTL